MEFKYQFTQSALQDFREILRYISTDLSNPIAAKNLGKKIFEKIDMVRDFPDSGVRVDNEFLSDKSVRKALVGNYIIYYKASYEEKMIYVVRIVYGKRNLDEILKSI